MATEKTNHHPRDVPCPNAEDISPCVCTVIDASDFDMEMDCSSVSSNTDLARIFSEHFPFNNFYSLIIYNNIHLRTIRAGDLGQISFKRIDIWSGNLQSVETNAFLHSYDTLEYLEISSNMLTAFPYSEISMFNHLTTLNLRSNQLGGIPTVASLTLQSLYLNNNPITGINPSSLPLLYTIGLSFTAITHIPTGTFSGLSRLTNIDLTNNKLEVLDPGTINLQTSYNWVYLTTNSITSIAEGALMGLRGSLYVQNNQLTELAEGVFRPLMDMDVTVYAESNPLACGCEIAWLVLNSVYVDQLMDDTTCFSGELVRNLDPDVYASLCH
ncbi:hypothetical protein Pmani_010744 [Petrolisthes manimaculis]|uniref:Oplophorus-luciferin 2-monooxygenase non-catalytic subunit n=1 Tax=Petrolisthes manimaculis TaxID=1843537 RepID=A0AAE1Q2G8_9EUCA|nr:hypothetical protein Pmani_010744 [Petrolisthes manimaculis]